MDDTAELVIDFGAGGNSEGYCRTGWYAPEPRHSWTQGVESTLEFPRPNVPGTYLMLLELGPFVWQEKLPAQSLSVLINGSEVGNFALREVGTVECRVPWALIEGREWVSVAFRHPDAAVPQATNGVADNRELAFAFELVTFYREADPGRATAAVAKTSARASGDSSVDGLPLHELMMQFESLGENCEFGLVQRRCGAEPLGLLRFASAPLPVLLAGLRERFEGLGEPSEIDIQVSENQQEYLVVDKRFGFLYHPWVLVGEADPEEIRQREVKRLPFLRRKLLEDLDEPHKMFVYRGMRQQPQVLVMRLVEALRTYGPADLLWMTLHDKEHPPGIVEAVAPGLLKGYIDRFAPGENAHALSLDCWITLCRNALALQRSDESP
jgi:hypothetical protein